MALTPNEHPALLEIPHPIACTVVGRLNRFVVQVQAGDQLLRASTNNTGRLADFVVPGKRCYCRVHPRPLKTDLSLFAIADSNGWAIVDTQLQMRAFENAASHGNLPWLEGCHVDRRDSRLDDSVIDYLFQCGERQGYLEVKSAVLREGEYAMYPDCPSARGRRHIRALTGHAEGGGKSIILFIAALPGVKAFKPYRDGDPQLYGLLGAARDAGVVLKALNIIYLPADSTIRLLNPDLPVELSQ